MPLRHIRAREAYRAVRPYPVVLARPLTLAALPQVDLRSSIQGAGLTVRNQGTRGTCSVFAMTFLLEFMYSTRMQGVPADLSEEYLNHVANLAGANTRDGDFFDNIDAGYRNWGIVPEATLPYQTTQVTTVAQEVLNIGRRWTRFQAEFVKEWDADSGATQAQVERAVACLDQRIPVACGSWWPRQGNWGTTVTRGVEVMNVPTAAEKTVVLEDGHSVALVGYRRDTAFPGGGYFVFRNSWGAAWGDQGYGYMPFLYVRRFTNDLVAFTTTQVKALRIGVQAVSRQRDRLDVFVTDVAGRVQGAAWQQGVMGGRWRGWWPVLEGRARAGSTVAVVARDPAKLDLFIPGTDGRTWTAAWDRDVADAQWRGWWNVQGGAVALGSGISAVARDRHKLDLFLVSSDRGVYTAAWDQHVADARWRGWWRILNGVAATGSGVTAVSRDPHKLDLFIVGPGGGVWTAAWDQHVAEARWRGWWRILSGVAAGGTGVGAVSRDPDKLDVFVVGTNGGIYTAAWDQHVGKAQWRGWWRIGTGVARPDSGVAVVSRHPSKLDVFVVGTNGGIYTAAWDQHAGGAQWRGWWRIGAGVAAPGSGIAAVSRDPEKLDVFVVGLDGAIWTAAWDGRVAAGEWRGWWRIGG